ncbi:acyl-CoA thioesterase [Agrobacterium tumefaciens]|uniref:acyl-CoA thioesterase n=1 Tax=Agrobacterium tumefaciens TaxID=358 RepID=UPI0005546F75|nr:acyl-CoA thioesterase [Agrobacterium tumefaciens]
MTHDLHSLRAYPWKTQHDLRFGDMDANGHINNGAFNALLESSRSLLLGSDEVKECGTYRFVLARFEIDYLRELTWPHPVRAGLAIVRLGKSSITMRQSLFSEAGCAAIALTTIVATDPMTGKPSELVADLRNVLGQWAESNGHLSSEQSTGARL